MNQIRMAVPRALAAKGVTSADFARLIRRNLYDMEGRRLTNWEVPTPDPAPTEVPDSIHMSLEQFQKLHRLGWISRTGQPLDWQHWRAVYNVDKLMMEESDDDSRNRRFQSN